MNRDSMRVNLIDYNVKIKSVLSLIRSNKPLKVQPKLNPLKMWIKNLTIFYTIFCSIRHYFEST